MNKYMSSQEFEAEIRSAVQGPPVRAEFVQRLETQLIESSKNKTTIRKKQLEIEAGLGCHHIRLFSYFQSF